MTGSRVGDESGTTNEDAEYFDELPNTGCEHNEGSVSIQRFRQSLKASLENARRTNVLAWGEEISLAKFFRSTIGKKIVMALTGAIGVGYVVAHMLGNLQVFEGAAKINPYAALLKSNVGLLWTARSILIAAVSLHVFVAYQLAYTSQKSRPVGYKRWRAVGSDFASRTMRWTGLLLAFFIG